MNPDRAWLARLSKLRVDRARGHPAPHKPLLLLALLNRMSDGAPLPPVLPLTPELAIVQLYPSTSPQDQATTTLVHHLRDDVIPASGLDARVGGNAAGSIDFSNYIAGRLPYLIGAVLILSFILLMAVFRSLLVPLKAVILNLMSIGAAYGVLVAVFQWGVGKQIIGVDKNGPIEAWIPMMMFAIVFGLSMDYEVFLLSRMKEHYDQTKNNAVAVADGLAVTARVITAAALIMVCVFLSFVIGDDRSLKMFGLGLAVAVAVDATVVRMLLVPATMELLGDRNWWIPKWIDRILPNIDVEGHHPVTPGESRFAAILCGVGHGAPSLLERLPQALAGRVPGVGVHGDHELRAGVVPPDQPEDRQPPAPATRR